MTYAEQDFDKLASMVSSSNVVEQHQGIIGLRKLLSKATDAPIKKFVDKNLIFICMWFIKQK